MTPNLRIFPKKIKIQTIKNKSMPTIGWFEILIVVAIAIIVLGPKDFPIMLKKVGSWIGTAKKYINNVQNEVSNIDIEDNHIEKKEDKKDE